MAGLGDSLLWTQESHALQRQSHQLSVFSLQQAFTKQQNVNLINWDAEKNAGVCDGSVAP